MSLTNNIPTKLRVPAQLALDAKSVVTTLSELQTLGTNNNLAYTYYKGMEVLCSENLGIYRWRPVKEGETGGTLPSNFTYPAGIVSEDGVVYSNIAYNFFEISLTGPQGETGPQGIQGETGPIGPIGPKGEPGEGSNILIENSATTIVNGDGVTIPYSVEVVNLQKEITTSYTLQASDHLHTIFLSPTTEMIITIPETGLPNNFAVGFYHVSPPGEYAIFFVVEDNLTQKLRVPSGFIATMSTNGNFSCMIERRLATQEYMLNGDLVVL